MTGNGVVALVFGVLILGAGVITLLRLRARMDRPVHIPGQAKLVAPRSGLWWVWVWVNIVWVVVGLFLIGISSTQ